MSTLSIPEFGLFIGIDWADEKHDVYVIDSSGKGKSETLLQSAEAINQWIQQKLQQAGGRPIAILFENARNGLFQSLLLREKVILYPINPKQFSSYRESHQNAGCKNDKNDARLLARLLCERIGVLRPLQLDDQETRKLDRLCQNRRHLVDQRVKSLVRLTSHLKASFPVLLELKLPESAMLALLKRWPDPRELKRAHPATLVKVLREAGLRNQEQCLALAEQIRQHQLLTLDNATHQAMAPLLKVECGLLRQLDQGIEEFEKLIEAEMKTHQDAKLFTALPGAGKALAPRLLTAFGSNRERFQHADEVASMSGIAPVTRQSGKSLQVVRRYACSNHVRQTFHEFANCARIWCPWSKAYYHLQRSRGMKHHAAVRKLAHRWIRILFQVWKTRSAYDPNRYLQSLIRKNPDIIPFLEHPKKSQKIPSTV
jgi:transposase